MRRVKILTGFAIAAGLAVWWGRVSAQEEVKTSMQVTYEIDEKGKTETTFEVCLQNLATERYAKNFKLSFTESEPKNIRAWEGRDELEVKTLEEGGGVMIEVRFQEAMVGKGKTRKFRVAMEDSSYVERLGEVWEISLPQIKGAEKFDEIEIELKVPQSLGKLAYISPEPSGKIETSVREIFYFTKENILNGGINLAFGEFQVYSFNLTYHLENPVKEKTKMEVAIPPDTAWQKVIYEKITPEPLNVVVDLDGNWIAQYELNGRERKDISVGGNVQIFAEPRKLVGGSDERLGLNRGESEYWQVNDGAIKQLAKDLGGVRRIYDFVIEQLNYDYERVRPNAKRMGALEALRRPNEAMCMEFTDLFIALCRAAGIPAREINGYAYTENTKLQPLSLVADVLHSWPEYWNEESKTWIGVDPTWADTTGGEDFFSKLDLRHFTFVIHGTDAEKPYSPGSYKLGANPQKDVYVSFSQLPEIRNAKPVISLEKKSRRLMTKKKYLAKIYNPGPTAIYQINTETLFDGEVRGKNEIAVIAPYGYDEFEVQVPGGILGWKLPEKITVNADGRKAEISTEKKTLVMLELTAIAGCLMVMAIVAIRMISKKK